MMAKLVFFFIFIFAFLDGFEFSLDDNASSATDFSGFWSSVDGNEVALVQKGQIKELQIHSKRFLEWRKDKVYEIYSFKSVGERYYLKNVAPSENYVHNKMLNSALQKIFRLEFVKTLCEKSDFKYTFGCKVAEYDYVKKQAKHSKEAYQKAMKAYLTRYIRHDQKEIEYVHAVIPDDFPKQLYNTDQTSLSFANKKHIENKPDAVDTKASLLYLSLSNEKVNIFINGLDFHHATYDRKERHVNNLNDWAPYYTNELFQEYYNLVYTWDPAFGIENDNTTQLEHLIEYIFERNSNNSINIVAHSHGGNLAKEVLIKLHDRGVDLSNIKLFTLGTPHMGIDEINRASKMIMPAVELAYNMFFNMREIDNVDGQIIQATKRLYSGSYDQLSNYDHNKYLRRVNDAFKERGLEKNIVLIAANDDEIVENKSSLWEDIAAQRYEVHNKHSDLVDSPDPQIFEIIRKHQ